MLNGCVNPFAESKYEMVDVEREKGKNMKRILIVEDNLELAGELKILLDRNNYEASYITKFNNIVEQIHDSNPDMVLLDINLESHCA